MNFFFVIDDNYIQQCLVTLNSIFHNNGGGHKIYIYSPSISEDNEEILRSFIHRNGSELNLHQKDDIGLDFTQMPTTRWNPIVFYKLYGMLNITDADRVLYLDCDIIVDGGLDELYRTEIENYYAAVVEDYGIPQIFWDPAYYLNRIGIHDSHEYFNAGMMLLNIKKIRAEMSMKLFVDTYKKWHDIFYFNEQDLLNMLWNKKLVYVPARYNRMSTDYEYRKRIKENQDAVIYHYTMNKPWMNEGTYSPEEENYQWCTDIYLKYCDFKEIEELYKIINDINSDSTLQEMSSSKLECGYNPHMIVHNGKEQLQSKMFVQSVGAEKTAERLLDAKQGLGRQNDLIDFLMRLYEKGVLGSREYFHDRGIKTIAIYGIGKICKIVEKELCESVNVACFIDSKKMVDSHEVEEVKYPVVMPDDMMIADVDAIIVTAIGYWTEIVTELEKVCDRNKIIAIEQILFDGSAG